MYLTWSLLSKGTFNFTGYTSHNAGNWIPHTKYTIQNFKYAKYDEYINVTSIAVSLKDTYFQGKSAKYIQGTFFLCSFN